MKTAEAWVKMPWDGNTALGLMCWRKRFGKGHVSVGCGAFLTITFSFGANSDRSYSSTRWRKDRILTEQEGMEYAEAQVRKENHGT